MKLYSSKRKACCIKTTTIKSHCVFVSGFWIWSLIQSLSWLLIWIRVAHRLHVSGQRLFVWDRPHVHRGSRRRYSHIAIGVLYSMRPDNSTESTNSKHSFTHHQTAYLCNSSIHCCFIFPCASNSTVVHSKALSVGVCVCVCVCVCPAIWQTPSSSALVATAAAWENACVCVHPCSVKQRGSRTQVGSGHANTCITTRVWMLWMCVLLLTAAQSSQSSNNQTPLVSPFSLGICVASLVWLLYPIVYLTDF